MNDRNQRLGKLETLWAPLRSLNLLMLMANSRESYMYLLFGLCFQGI